jgi:hypothetical protein
MRTRRLLITLSVVVLALPLEAASAATLLRANGIGPLKIGMTRAAAVNTGWLAHPGLGCELAGSNRPYTYQLNGPNAPRGLRGSVEFARRTGRLRTVNVTGGVRTAVGVVVNQTTTAQMVRKYRAAGFAASARYDSTFQGTFVNVRRNGRQVFQAFAQRQVIGTLAIPFVPVCE